MDLDNFYDNSPMSAEAPQAEAVQPRQAGQGKDAAEILYPSMRQEGAEEATDALADAANGEPVTLAAIAQEDAVVAKELGEFLRQNDLPEAHAGKLAEMHKKATDRAARQFWGNPEDWREEVDSDPAITRSLPAVRALVRESSEGKDFALFLAKARLDAHPTVLRFLARVAQSRGQRGGYLED